MLKSEFTTHAQQILLSPHVCVTISDFLLLEWHSGTTCWAHAAVMWPDEGPWSADGSGGSLDAGGGLPRTFTSCFNMVA